MQSGELTIIRMQGKKTSSFTVGTTVAASETEVVDIRRKFANGWRKMKVNKPRAISEIYNKQMGWVDVFDQLKSYTEVQLRFRKWTVRVAVTIFQAALLNVRAIWIHYTNPPKKRRNVVDFFARMLDLLLESAGMPPADADNVGHWLTKANEPRNNRSYCWVCHKKRPNLTCLDCGDGPILCLDCAESYHNDMSRYKPYKKRDREEEKAENEAEEGNEEEANEQGAPQEAEAEEGPNENDAIAFAQQFMLDQMAEEGAAEDGIVDMDVD